jgi:predicted Rossmann-fold nucleotide-binding protein
MKTQVGVMGSAGGALSEEQLELARRLGRRIAHAEPYTVIVFTGSGLMGRDEAARWESFPLRTMRASSSACSRIRV